MGLAKLDMVVIILRGICLLDRLLQHLRIHLLDVAVDSILALGERLVQVVALERVI
jgi:hypothetical protein